MTLTSDYTQVRVPLNPNLTKVLDQDGFVIFIEGNKGKGKTNFALLLAEICKAYELRKHIATNVKCESYFVSHITNFPDLKDWLIKEKGKKLFILDESGKHISRMAFMTAQNKSFMDVLQLIRHYDCGFIGIAPSMKRVDTGFLNTDILDAVIRKTSLKCAKVFDFLNQHVYFLYDLPRTSISHSSKDLAEFEMKKEIDPTTMQKCCKAAHYYKITKNLEHTGKYFDPPLSPTQVKRLLIDHLEHTTS